MSEFSYFTDRLANQQIAERVATAQRSRVPGAAPTARPARAGPPAAPDGRPSRRLTRHRTGPGPLRTTTAQRALQCPEPASGRVDASSRGDAFAGRGPGPRRRSSPPAALPPHCATPAVQRDVRVRAGQPVQQLAGLRGRGVRHQRDELVAAVAGQQVGRADRPASASCGPGSTSSRSPAAWPSRSFTVLKSSRSIDAPTVTAPLAAVRR